MPSRGATLTVDVDGADALRRGMATLEHDLAEQGSGRLRAAANRGADALIVALRGAAATAATPQAKIVASSMRVAREGDVGVAIGGAAPVGSRGTAAGTLLWGSEHGGRNFGAPRGGSYWITPATEGFASGTAERLYLEAVSAMLRDARL